MDFSLVKRSSCGLRIFTYLLSLLFEFGDQVLEVAYHLRVEVLGDGLVLPRHVV